MATILPSLIDGLTSAMVQARLESINAKPFLFGQYFPVKKINGFTWATLSNQIEKGNVAADLHTDNGTIIRKSRPVFQTARGDVPFIAISRQLNRMEIKDYQIAQAFAALNDPASKELLDYWANDVDFCFNGVQNELNFIAWQLASRAGVLNFTTANNATYANEFNLDYGVADENKETVSTSWDDKGADIIGDLTRIVRKAQDMGLNPKFAFINQKELYRIATSEQIMKMNSTLSQNVAGIYTPADLTQINGLLTRQAWLNGIQLVVIDQSVTRELQDGTRTTANPFEDFRLVLSETQTLGSTQYDILQETNNLILRAERSHTVVKKYSTVEPYAEITIGQADALPVFDTAYRNIYVRTDGQEW